MSPVAGKETGARTQAAHCSHCFLMDHGFHGKYLRSKLQSLYAELSDFNEGPLLNHFSKSPYSVQKGGNAILCVWGHLLKTSTLIVKLS